MTALFSDEQLVAAVRLYGQSPTYVVANILSRETKGPVSTAQALRRLKTAEKKGLVVRVRPRPRLQITWALPGDAP